MPSLLTIGVNLMKSEPSRFILIQEFESAPARMLFSQSTVAAIHQRSFTVIQHDVWAVTGVKFIPLGLVDYRKSDIQNWLDQNCAIQSIKHNKRNEQGEYNE
jgi:hypothetical protein